MTVTTVTHVEPWAARNALAELRRATEFQVPERILSFWEERRPGRLAPAGDLQVRPTDIPQEWSGPDEPQPLMPDKHMSKFAGRAWHWALNRARKVAGMFDLEQQVAHLKQRQRALMETISFHEENDTYLENLSVQIDEDFFQSFGSLRRI